MSAATQFKLNVPNVAVALGIVAFVAGICVACALALGSAAAGGASAVVVVHDGDGNTTRMALDEGAERTFTTSLGSNTVVVEDGEVYVSWADCDGNDCVHQGKISAPGRQIICLPHKLWVEVGNDGELSGSMDESKAAGESDDFDTVGR